MSKPTNKNHTLEGLMLYLFMQSKWIASEKQRFLSNYGKPWNFLKGGIVAGEVHQDEAIINQKADFIAHLQTLQCSQSAKTC